MVHPRCCPCLHVSGPRIFLRALIWAPFTTLVSNMCSTFFSSCYSTALVISRSNLPRKPLKSVSAILDFRGFREPPYVVLAAGTFVASLGLYVPYYYIEPFAVSLQRLAPQSGATSLQEGLLPIINAASFVGRILGGQAADTLGRRNVLWPMTLACGILCLAGWLVTKDMPGVVIFVVLYGLYSGVIISVTPAVVGQNSPPDKLGARIGALFSVTAFATLAGSPIAGALIREGGSTGDGYVPLIAFAVSLTFYHTV